MTWTFLADAKNVQVIYIDDGKINYCNSHYGIDINESIQEFQQTDEVPRSIKQLSDKIYDAVDDGEFNSAELLLKELEEDLEENHPLVTKFRTLLDLETMDWEGEQ